MPDHDTEGRIVDCTVAAAALAGLRASPKTLPPWLFYDEEGCRLFYRITELPEYYLTRTERQLLKRVAPDIAQRFGAAAVLIEYGASDEEKAGYLLQTRAFRAYVPIDVAEPALAALRGRMAHDRPDLAVYPIVADFQRPILLPGPLSALPRLGFFPGSTIGNLEPNAVRRFLRQALETLGTDAEFLVGIDLRKDPDILVPAYDDATGVTACFNRNLLVRLNREAGANFDLSAFAHRSVWNDQLGRIEMHLVSLCDQVARIGGETISFAAGETIHTENSYKYTEQAFESMAADAGWRTLRCWTDPQRRFALCLLRPAG